LASTFNVPFSSRSANNYANINIRKAHSSVLFLWRARYTSAVYGDGENLRDWLLCV
jgi:dTDP-D-glucose 4,6-dehydratase